MTQSESETKLEADIVERLRKQHEGAIQSGIGWGAYTSEESATVVTVFSEAADEITRLRAEPSWAEGMRNAANIATGSIRTDTGPTWDKACRTIAKAISDAATLRKDSEDQS